MPTTRELQEARRHRREAALAARASMSPSGPAPDRLRIATWNLNSLRARAGAVERFLDRARPDVLLLQETKCRAVAPEPAAVFERAGYHLEHLGAGGYNGVAIASVHPISDVIGSGSFGDEHLDREPRVLSAVIGHERSVRVVSVYAPHGREVGHWHFDYKLAFLAALRDRAATWLRDGSLLIGGDINVAPTDSDVFHPDAFIGLTHVTPDERAAWAALLEAGLIDLDAAKWGPRERRFTWWMNGLNYGRNLGMRIDMLAADPELAQRLDTTWIDHVERGADRPSDHAALVADFF